MAVLEYDQLEVKMFISRHTIGTEKAGQISALSMYSWLKPTTTLIVAGFMSLVSIPPVHAEDQPAMDLPEVGSQTEIQQQRLRDQLLTAEERNNFKQKMRSAKSQKERKIVRARQRKLLKQRAQAKGISLPKEPQTRGKGRRNSSAGFSPNRF